MKDNKSNIVQYLSRFFQKSKICAESGCLSKKTEKIWQIGAVWAV